MSEHPNAALVRRGFDRFVGGDPAGLLELFAPEAVWHVPGANAMSGDYRGLDEIIAFLRRTAELTGGTYRVELLWVVADDDHAVAVYRAQGARDGERSLDIEQALLIRVEDGRWVDVRAQPLDQRRSTPSGPTWTITLQLPHRRPAGADLRMLVEEQAALNRVAVTVATETASERVFDVVTEEVARLLGADAANLVRFGPGSDEGVIVGKWSEPGVQIPGAGTVVVDRWRQRARRGRADGRARSAGHGRPRRPRGAPRAAGRARRDVARRGADRRVRATSGAPSSSRVTRDLQFAANAEERLGQFAGLVAVALANTQAREELATLADEQAALSRVAVAVATEETRSGSSTPSPRSSAGCSARGPPQPCATSEMPAARDRGRLGARRPARRRPARRTLVPVQGGAIARVAQTGRTTRIDLENAPPDLQEHMVEAEVSVRRGGSDRGLRATLVVSEEVGRLFDADAGAIVRYADELDGAVIVGAWQRIGRIDVPLGVKLPLEGGAIARVAQTGRTARIDLEAEPSDLRERMLAAKVNSGVAAPIVVSGRLWGATSISNGRARRVSARRRGAPREVHEPRRRRACERGGPRAADRIARPHRPGRRRRATAARAEPPRRRTAAPGDARARAPPRRVAASRRSGSRRGAARARRAKSSRSVWRSFASSLAGSIRRSSPTAASHLRSRRSPTRATLPVEVSGLPPDRLPEAIEAAAFYVVSESLANVAKYASASRARVDLARDDGLLVVEVSDDGVGGADAGKGSGLRGLADRVEALGGHLRVSSEPGRGTTVRAELPMPSDAPVRRRRRPRGARR